MKFQRRVLVVTNMYPHPDDPARGAFVEAQVAALRELDVPVEVEHIRGDLGSSNYARAIGRVRRAADQFRADLIYGFYGLSGWVSLWQPRPLVLSLAGDDVLGTPDGRGGITAKSRVAVWLSQWAAQRAAIVCVQSQEMLDRLWGAGLRDRALVVPYGVDPRRFHPGDYSAARQRLGMPEDELTVIFPNTPTERRKRFDLAEAAMSIVRVALPNASMRVVTRVPHTVMPYYYQAADCCLLTSDWEGSPNVVKEALLSGVPVVTTDVGDVRRWVLLSPESAIAERTPEALASAIISVLKERRRVDPAIFREGFGSAGIAKQMLSLFERALAAPTELA